MKIYDNQLYANVEDLVVQTTKVNWEMQSRRGEAESKTDWKFRVELNNPALLYREVSDFDSGNIDIVGK